jgi:phosphoesterase RecJ-like protein
MSSVVDEIQPIISEPPVVAQICDVIRNNSYFIIAGHLRPDGDCFGSCLGMYELLRNMGKHVRFYTAGPLQEFFQYLPNFDKIETSIPQDQPDAWLVLDSGGLDRVHDEFKPTGLIVNIDHHISNTRFGTFNWVDTEATAAGEQIYRLALALEQPITPEIATCLYTALMTDTGGFRYSNTDEMTFKAAAHLVLSGAKPATIAEAVFDSRKPESVRLTGEVYANLHFEFGGQFVWSEITNEMFNKVGGEYAEPDGLASDIRGIEGVQASVLFFETQEEWCRLGLRSKGNVNVSALAQLLGGGGHHNASGAMIREPYVQARDRALRIIREYLQSKLPAPQVQ